MSSSHYIVVARHHEIGKLEFPLEDMTLYGMGQDPETGEYEEESIVRTWAANYDEGWTLSLYAPLGGSYYGTKKPAK